MSLFTDVVGLGSPRQRYASARGCHVEYSKEDVRNVQALSAGRSLTTKSVRAGSTRWRRLALDVLREKARLFDP
jgi:ribosomal protein L14E/L6E/L27E